MRKRARTSSDPIPADILLTLPELGISVDKVNGQEAWAICPNPEHPERSASWSINIITGQHNCFACGFGGRFLDLVVSCKDLEPESATAWVRQHGGIEVAIKKLRGEQAYVKEEAEEVTEADMALFDTLIPIRELRKRDIIQEACEEYGVMWDPAKGNWILPIRDPHTNRLMGWQAKGRKGFVQNVPDHVEKSLTIFGYHLLGETAYVEESPLDDVRLLTYNVEGAVSGYGVHISDYQMNLIIDHPKVKRVVMCLDNDRAGRIKEAEIWQKYRGRTRLYFANYEHTRQKDHGDMDPEEIEYSLEHAISAVRFRPSRLAMARAQD